MKYSFIIPVYNRPDEVDELLASLLTQTVADFEVVIVEDGSSKPCKEVCDKYAGKLDLHYHMKPNSGPGQSRNYGAEPETMWEKLGLAQKDWKAILRGFFIPEKTLVYKLTLLLGLSQSDNFELMKECGCKSSFCSVLKFNGGWISTSILIFMDLSVWNDTSYTSVLSFKKADSTFPNPFLSFFLISTSRPTMANSSMMGWKYFVKSNLSSSTSREKSISSLKRWRP